MTVEHVFAAVRLAAVTARVPLPCVRHDMTFQVKQPRHMFVTQATCHSGFVNVSHDVTLSSYDVKP